MALTGFPEALRAEAIAPARVRVLDADTIELDGRSPSIRPCVTTVLTIDTGPTTAPSLSAWGCAIRMAAMDAFDHILNWKLKEGSHLFLGRDGGTCINEAAIVAAGFEYRPVRGVEEMPECFSRPICKLAMQLNDMAPDDERQRLLPFVTRLACADTREVEAKRASFIKSPNVTV
jgi:hypothetical protein